MRLDNIQMQDDKNYTPKTAGQRLFSLYLKPETDDPSFTYWESLFHGATTPTVNADRNLLLMIILT